MNTKIIPFTVMDYFRQYLNDPTEVTTTPTPQQAPEQTVFDLGDVDYFRKYLNDPES